MPQTKKNFNKHEGFHKYKQIKIGKNRDKGIFACQIPGCNHYLFPEMILNKWSLCNRCNEPFIIGVVESKQVKPHCKECKIARGNYNLLPKRKKVDENAVGDLLSHVLSKVQK